jgi:hypothetical protein
MDRMEKKKDNKRRRLVTVIRRSCITGTPIWVYQGPSHSAAMRAYQRACKREIERMKTWATAAERRMADVAALVSRFTASLPEGVPMTPEQAEAARRLRAIQKAVPECHREFYDHVIEERRRRAEDREIRRRMRERDKQRNRDYDKRG